MLLREPPPPPLVEAHAPAAPVPVAAAERDTGRHRLEGQDVVNRFVDRDDELKFLQGSWASAAPQLIVLYGRRRVGKTALIRQFASIARVAGRRGRRHPHRHLVHYIAARLPEAQQLAELGQAVGRALGEPLLVENGFRDWSQVFDLAARAPLALALDEFPYLTGSSQALATLIQRAWDTSRAGAPSWLLLCGSSVAMMERETLDAASPLFGRRTGHLKLGPLPFAAAREFLGGYPFEDAVRTFAIVGGIPQYLQLVDPSRSLAENVRALTLDVGAPLADEVEFLLQEELSETRIYFGILAAIASGKRKFGEILNATQLPPGGVSKYLAVLQALGLVEREVPVTEHAPEKSKRGLYRICDPLVRFSFRHLLPQRARVQTGQVKEALSLIAADFDTMAGWVYEDLCRDLVARGGLGARPGWRRVGRWWDRHDEIDVVAIGDDRVLAGEAKWSRRPVGEDVLRSLEEKVARARFGARTTFALFSRSGFTAAVEAAAARRRDLVLVGGLGG